MGKREIIPGQLSLHHPVQYDGTLDPTLLSVLSFTASSACDSYKDWRVLYRRTSQLLVIQDVPFRRLGSALCANMDGPLSLE